MPGKNMVLLLWCTFAEVCAEVCVAEDGSRSLARACCAPQAGFPQPSASWSPLIILSTCSFYAWSYFRELEPKFRSWKVNYFPCLFLCVQFAWRERGETVNHLQVYISPHSYPEWMWKLFLGLFSETAKLLSIVETVVSTQIRKKHTVGISCYWRVSSP